MSNIYNCGPHDVSLFAAGPAVSQASAYMYYVTNCILSFDHFGVCDLTEFRKAGRKTSRAGKEPSKHKAKGSVKYSAARLHEKGVVLEIEGLPTNQ